MSLKNRVKALEIKLKPEDEEAEFLYFSIYGQDEPIGLKYDRNDYYLQDGETFDELKERVQGLVSRDRTHHVLAYIYE